LPGTENMFLNSLAWGKRQGRYRERKGKECLFKTF
jgi:hypothetical protein